MGEALVSQLVFMKIREEGQRNKKTSQDVKKRGFCLA